MPVYNLAVFLLIFKIFYSFSFIQTSSSDFNYWGVLEIIIAFLAHQWIFICCDIKINDCFELICIQISFLII